MPSVKDGRGTGGAVLLEINNGSFAKVSEIELALRGDVQSVEISPPRSETTERKGDRTFVRIQSLGARERMNVTVFGEKDAPFVSAVRFDGNSLEIARNVRFATGLQFVLPFWLATLLMGFALHTAGQIISAFPVEAELMSTPSNVEETKP